MTTEHAPPRERFPTPGAGDEQTLTRLVRPGAVVTVLGIGFRGGALGAIRWLASRGVRLRVVDDAPAEHLAPTLRTLKHYVDPESILWEFGGASRDVLHNCDLLVVNPAVRPTHPLVREANKSGLPITTEIGLFLTHCPAPIVAITGTNGKTTTTLTTHRILKHSRRRAWVGGNLGISLLPRLPAIRADHVVVLELSSFQLFWLRSCPRMVDVSVVTSFARDHLDWHPSLSHYRATKQSLLHRTRPDGICILNATDDEVSTWTAPSEIVYAGANQGWNVSIDEAGISVDLDDQHGRLAWPDRLRHASTPLQVNIALATAAALVAGGNLEGLLRTLATFRPVPHRLQYIGCVGHRHIVDDSVATSPHATAEAIRWAAARWPDRIWVILGGRSKGQDYRPLMQLAAAACRGIALVGENRGTLLALLPRTARQAAQLCDSLQEALEWCLRSSSAGDVILFSPASASTDMFRDYRERGRSFRRLIRTATQRSPHWAG